MIGLLVVGLFLCCLVGWGIAVWMNEDAKRQAMGSNNIGVGCLGTIFGVAIFALALILVGGIMALMGE